MLFALLRFGNIAKYIPHPVLAGLLNGTATLVFLGQFEFFFGIGSDTLPVDFDAFLASLDLANLLVGLTTAAVIVWGRWKKVRFSPPVLGILAGALLHFLLKTLGLAVGEGMVVGTLTGSLPTPHQGMEFYALATRDGLAFWPLVLEMTPLALSLSFVISLATLLASITSDRLMVQRSDPNRELMSQGIGNMTASLFGGAISVGSITRTEAVYRSGGRTNLSQALSGVLAMAVLLYLHPVIAMIPKAAIAAVLMVLSLNLFDRWSLGLAAKLIRGRSRSYPQDFFDFLLVLLVMAVMLQVGVFHAIILGAVLYILLFLHSIGKNIFHGQYRGDKVRANVQRNQVEVKTLSHMGSRIQIFELEGAMFFGTADKVSETVENLLKTDVTHVILDFHLIAYIDTTGLSILKKLARICKQKKVQLFVSAMDTGLGDDLDVTFFDSVESALARAEDQLLDQVLDSERYQKTISIREVDALNAVLKETDWPILEAHLERRIFKAGEYICRQDEPGDSMFYLVQGRAKVMVGFYDQPKRRVATLCPGTVVGEMSIFDDQPRAADLIAEGPMTVYVLSCEALLNLLKIHPVTAYRLLIGVGSELATRLRLANQQVFRRDTGMESGGG